MSPAAVLTIVVNAQTAAANASLMKTDAQLKKTAATANSTSSAMSGKLAKGARLAGAAVAGMAAYGLYKAIKVGADFEKQMDSLGAVTEATDRQMKRLEKQALKLGQATVFSANDVAKAQTELAKGGLTVKQILGGALPAALSLAAAGELDLAAAAETTVNAMKLFGLGGKESMKVADMLATAANTTTADVTDFAMALKQGGAAAKIAGLDLNNTITILEALAEVGIKNSDAGTSMKAALLQLIKPTERQKDLAAALGIEWINQAGSMKGAVAISKELRDATEGMTKSERAKTLATLAGTDGFRALAALYDAGPAKLKRLATANLETGTAQEIARKKADNLAGDVEKLSGAWEALSIKISRVTNPALREVVQWMTDAVNAVSNFSFRQLRHELGLTKADIRAFSNAVRNVAEVVQRVFGPVVKSALRAAAQAFDAFKQGVRGTIRVISGVLTGDFGKAWRGVRDVFSSSIRFVLAQLRAANAPFRLAAQGIDKALTEVFGGAWDKIKDIFKGGLNAVIDLVNQVIGVINKIPGVNKIVDIGEVGKIGGGGGKGKAQRKQTGGSIVPGTGSGDTFHTALPARSFILNREASKASALARGGMMPVALEPGERVFLPQEVSKVGLRTLEAANKAVPRFQEGGLVQKFGIGGAVRDVVGSVVGKGADFFIDKLPKPNIPQPLTGVGPWMIEHVAEWIKDGFKTKKLGDLSIAPGALGKGAVADALRKAIAIGAAHGSGVSSFKRPGTGGSYHDPAYSPPHQAVDLAGGNMLATAKGIVRAFGIGRILELFHDPLGYAVDNYAKAAAGTGGPHYDHVHTAFQQGGLLQKLIGGGLVQASVYGFGEPGTGTQGYRGDYLPGHQAYAELEMGTALGGLPYKHMLQISRAGKSVVAPKLDIGAGGPLNPKIDLWEHTARALGLSSTFSGKVRIDDAGGAGGEPARPATPLAEVFRNVPLGKNKGRAKALRKQLGKIRGIGLDPDMLGRLSGLSNDATRFSEYAENASVLTLDTGTGDPIQGMFRGMSEGDWLTQELDALFTLRNTLLHAHDQVVNRREQIAKMIREAHGRLQEVKKAIHQGEKQRDRLLLALAAARKAGDVRRVAHIAGNLWVLGRQQKDRRNNAGQIQKVIEAAEGQRATLNTTRGEVLGTGGDRFRGLETVQGMEGPMNLMSQLPEIGVLGGDILGVQGRLRDINQKVSITDNSTSGGDSELLALTQQLLREANQRAAISDAALPVLSGWDSLMAKVRAPFGGSHPKSSAPYQAGGALPFLGAFADGGRAMRKGMALIGERGPEIVEFGGGGLPIGSQIHPNGVIPMAQQSSGPPHIEITVYEGAQTAQVTYNGQDFEAKVKRIVRKETSPGRVTPGGMR